jgi:uncharacterized RDD family membrane protein YckC
MSRLTLARLFAVACMAAYVLMLTPASARAPTVPAAPTRLDYVVLASLADSPYPLSMSTYR